MQFLSLYRRKHEGASKHKPINRQATSTAAEEKLAQAKPIIGRMRERMSNAFSRPRPSNRYMHIDTGISFSPR